MNKAMIALCSLLLLNSSAFAEVEPSQSGLNPLDATLDTRFRIEKDRNGQVRPERRQEAEMLLQKARDNGVVPIIAKLATPFQPEGKLKSLSISLQRNAISSAQQRTIAELGLSTVLNPAGIKRFITIPYLALEVDAAGLQRLIESKEILDIAEDGISVPALDDTIPQIGADYAHSIGATASGKVIAVLDTGVDKNHSFLSGKIVSEACYSKPPTGSGGAALCPGGSTSSIATNSALPCAFSGCDHGTHVAGIAAGKGTSFSGVAKDAKLIAIQVFYRSTTGLNFSTDSDQILAMERVYALRNTHSIAAVNLSLGSNATFTGTCDTDARKAIIDNLRSAKIATVISTGNSGSQTGISKPACISTSVAVGSVTKNDAVPSYSNSSSVVDLLAPGGTPSPEIRSSVPGNLFALKSGTSMSAPHVAGTFAIFRAKYPSASAAGIEAHLKNTGPSITDVRNGVTKPRINVRQALIQPNAPATLTITFVGVCTGKNDISWSQPTIGDNLSYQGQFSTNSSFPPATTGTFHNGTATNDTITVSQPTYIRVKACSGSNCSVWKNSYPNFARPGENCN